MKLTTTIASAAVAGVLGLAGVSVAGASATGSSPARPAAASSPTTAAGSHATAPTTTPAGPGRHASRAARRRHRLRRAAVIAARTIRIKPRALVRELRSGKTIAQVATEHGVQPQAVIDALESAVTARINAAQTAGKITADRAARLKQRAAVAIPRIVDDWHPRSRHAG
jgi:hypothetical protein